MSEGLTEAMPEDGYQEKLKSALELIDQESRYAHERFSKYRTLLEPIYQALPEEERGAFLENPVNFISKNKLFRGLSENALLQLVQEREMTPSAGDYSHAVFLTDSPCGAVDFMSGKKSGLAILEPEKLNYKDENKKIYDDNDLEFRKMVNDYLDSLSPEERENAKWFAQDPWDTRTIYSMSRPWHTIHLRKPQPVNALSEIIVLDSDNKPKVLDPNNSSDLEYLKEMLNNQ